MLSCDKHVIHSHLFDPRVFIELSGGAVSSLTVGDFINIINTGSLFIPVDQVEEGEFN